MMFVRKKLPQQELPAATHRSARSAHTCPRDGLLFDGEKAYGLQPSRIAVGILVDFVPHSEVLDLNLHRVDRALLVWPFINGTTGPGRGALHRDNTRPRPSSGCCSYCYLMLN